MRAAKMFGVGVALSAGLVGAGMANASPLLSLGGQGQTLTGGSGAYGLSTRAYGSFSWTSFQIDVTQTPGESLLALTIGGLKTSSAGTLGVSVYDDGFTFVPTGVGTGQRTSASTNGANTASGDNALIQGILLSDSNPLHSSILQSFTLQETAGTSSVASYTTPVSAASSVVGPYSLTLTASITLNTANTDVLNSASAGVAVTALPLPGSGPLALLGGAVMIGGLVLRYRIAQ